MDDALADGADGGFWCGPEPLSLANKALRCAFTVSPDRNSELPISFVAAAFDRVAAPPFRARIGWRAFVGQQGASPFFQAWRLPAWTARMVAASSSSGVSLSRGFRPTVTVAVDVFIRVKRGEYR